MIGAGRKDRFLVIIGLVLVVSVFGVFWVRHRMAANPAPQRSEVNVIAVQPHTAVLSEILTVRGILEADRLVPVIPRVSGRITDLFFDVGDMVREDDLLACVDPEAFDLELRSAESAWLLAESSLSRLERLGLNSGASRQEIEEARTARDAALSSYKLAGLRRDYADIRSPLSGRVLERLAEKGGMASPEMPVFSIGDVATYEVRCRIPEKHWDAFTATEKIRATVFRSVDDEDVIAAAVGPVSPVISRDGRCFEISCRMGGEEVPWPVGTGVTVRFILSETLDVWSLPLDALGVDGGLWWIDPADSCVHRMEAAGLARDDHRIAVPADRAHRLYVLEGQHLLSEGLHVRTVSGTAG